MIYIVFGPPLRVTRSDTRETWFYENSQTNQEIRFEFNLKQDFWWGYDFALHRMEEYRTLWNMAITSWRKGKIFSL